jgi:peptide/nickel transport system substrate-binding protein
LNGDWGHFDSQIVGIGNPGNSIARSVYDRLLIAAPNRKLVPYIAKSWKITPTTLTFNLRDDVTCADGTQLTPTAVKASFARLLKGPGASSFGPGPFSLAADDAAGTFTISLGAPDSEAIYGVANALIVCPAGLANPDSLKTTPMGSGPYKLESAVHGNQAVMSLRPDWKWGPSNITSSTVGIPEKLIFKVVENDSTAANLLITGGLDIAQVNGPDVARLLANKSLNHKQVTSFGTTWLMFNQTPGHPTADDTIRQALMTAVDPKAWNQAANQGRGTVSPSIIQPGGDCFDPSTASLLPTPSVDKAKALLQSAGYAVGGDGKLVKDGKPLKIRLIGTPSFFGAGTEYVAEQWNKVGITVDLADSDFATWLASLRTFNNFDVSAYPTVGNLPNPSNYMAILTGRVPPAGNNLARNLDPAVDKEYAAALASEGAERCLHYSNVQKLLLQHHDVLPLAAPILYWFSRPGIDYMPGIDTTTSQFTRRVA